ncbi:universal stress protein [Thalassobaculum sp.]|uniref:universal stress protein n=1 Tax=Thalassobaculum sp. TaxID=2022740 RepID=UPI0032EB722E
MALKNLLVHLDPSRSSLKRAETAIALAVGHGAHLTALAVAHEPSMPSYVEAEIPAAVFSQMRANLKTDLATIVDTFSSQASAAGIAFETRTELTLNPVDQLIARHARYTDLVIMGQADTSDPLTGSPELVEDVLLGSGRPALIVPYIGAQQRPGRRVMVAWDAGREAARAVNDALPVLEAAEQVVVAIVNPRPGRDGHGEQPGADIATHLARHGVKVEVQVYNNRDLSVSEVLLARIADENVDLVVLGAYGHTRLREMVLGGVTHDMLRTMTVPLFMSH